MSDPIKIKLNHPIQFGSDVIDELALRKPKAKDFRAMPATNITMGDMLTMISKLSGQPTQVIDELDVEDMHRVAEAVAGFFPGAQRTGTEP